MEVAWDCSVHVNFMNAILCRKAASVKPLLERNVLKYLDESMWRSQFRTHQKIIGMDGHTAARVTGKCNWCRGDEDVVQLFQIL